MGYYIFIGILLLLYLIIGLLIHIYTKRRIKENKQLLQDILNKLKERNCDK